ncbi:DUF3182 family protein [Ochrobactrum sp. Kaboul]|nr:DUF3182 family protein [Ochrobactrum sp. Kaboul]
MDVIEKICVVSQTTDSKHNVASVEALAARLAKLSGSSLSPSSQNFDDVDGTFFIPTVSLIRKSHPELDANQFWGGCVDQEYMTTKLATHPAWNEEDELPAGWKPQFAKDLGSAALAGFSVFSHDHAARAGAFLLDKSKIRLKDPYASGGKNQCVFENNHELDVFLQSLSQSEITKGMVIEEDVENSSTYSVGQVSLAGLTASYLGRQYIAHDPMGESVYAGSRLYVVRGGWDELLLRLRMPVAHRIIEGARRYDMAAGEHFGLVASRKNYDVLVGPITEDGFCCGVLEQSWRVGGASPAEILAVEAMIGDQSILALQVLARETYGAAPRFEINDFIVYVGQDDTGQPLHKYARIEKIYHDP